MMPVPGMGSGGDFPQRCLDQNGSTMADDPDRRYEDARRHFEELDVEEKASFLVEAAASTLARGVSEAGEVLAGTLEDLVRQARTGSSRASETRGPGAAEPETSQRRSPGNAPPADDLDE